jgi:hypothetical protein
MTEASARTTNRGSDRAGEEKLTSSATEFRAGRGEAEPADSFLGRRRPPSDPPRRAPPAKIPGRARANTPRNAYMATTPMGDCNGRREERQRGRGQGVRLSIPRRRRLLPRRAAPANL